MNCIDLRETLDDVACGRTVAPADRDAALEHAETCARCAARLADGRALTDALRAAARDDLATSAPPRAKAAAMAAFRERATAPAGAAPASPARRMPAWALAAAAVVALAASAAGLWALSPNGAAPALPQPSEVANTAPPTVPGPNPTAPTGPPPGDTSHPPSGPAKTAVHEPRRPARREAPAAIARTKKTESVTDFIALTYMDDSVAMAGGHMVRVEVPRSSLATFGIPVPDGASGVVKADVVIGDDGVARAIRFVQ